MTKRSDPYRRDTTRRAGRDPVGADGFVLYWYCRLFPNQICSMNPSRRSRPARRTIHTTYRPTSKRAQAYLTDIADSCTLESVPLPTALLYLLPLSSLVQRR